MINVLSSDSVYGFSAVVVFTVYGFNAVYISVFSLPFSVSAFLRINVFITVYNEVGVVPRVYGTHDAELPLRWMLDPRN